jgi:hypothetical protein
VVQETEVTQVLWVHQESAVIAADSYDVWSFTPEFLLSNEIVPGDWTCTQATRDMDEAVIQYGPVHWGMTERSLWITSYPDCPIEDESRLEGEHAVPNLVRRYLRAVPYLPAQNLWFFWRVEVANPQRHEWSLNNFFGKKWPTNLGSIDKLQPTLDFSVEDVLFRLIIDNEQSRIRHNISEERIIFECYASNPEGRSIGQILSEAHRLSDRLNTFKQAINHLLEEGDQE